MLYRKAGDQESLMNDPRTPIDLDHHVIATDLFGQIQWDDRANERARSKPDLHQR
jgi:hypothetical protein